MNPDFHVGDLMVITDHINFFPEHPLRGKNDPIGPRFPDMHEAYDHELVALADEIGREKGIKLQHGVYVGVQGPTFETPAEYRMYRLLGGDAVGMSTVPEVIVARHSGIRVFGVSVITDLGGFDGGAGGCQCGSAPHDGTHARDDSSVIDGWSAERGPTHIIYKEKYI